MPEMVLKAVTWTEKVVSAAEIMSCFTLLGSTSALLVVVAMITVPAITSRVVASGGGGGEEKGGEPSSVCYWRCV